MFDDQSQRFSDRPAARLLNELESIKGVLADSSGQDTGAPGDIPLLDDMVIHNLDANANLLNIPQIFDDAATESEQTGPAVQFPHFTLDATISDPLATVTGARSAAPAAATKPRVRPDYSREVLIQELVDEFIPQIEAELHKRLGQLDEAVLRSLKNAD